MQADKRRLVNVLQRECYGRISERLLANLTNGIFKIISVFVLICGELPRPSAIPRNILHAIKAVILDAKNGVINVAIVHNKTLHIRTFFAPNFVAQKLPTIPTN